MKKACVLLAEGFEEIEAVTIIDVLRRADVAVSILGVGADEVTGAHGIRIRTDAVLAGSEEPEGKDKDRGKDKDKDEDEGQEIWDAVILPGGMPGATNLRDDESVQVLLSHQHAEGRVVAAICAAPIALAQAGILQGRAATCYPGFADQLTGAEYHERDDVVVDGNVITSRGPGTALAFAFRLVTELVDDDTAEQLRSAMLARG